MISGTPTTAGVYMVTATATDSVTGAGAEPNLRLGCQPDHAARPRRPTEHHRASINLTLTANAPAGDPVTFSATGLPPGLTVNSTSGIISSARSRQAPAAISSWPSAPDTTTGASTSGEILWVVAAPVDLAAPGNQQNYDGDAVSLQLSATSSGGDPLFYSVASATPLPAGLSLDPWTGVISGTLNASDDANSPCTVTVSTPMRQPA